MAELKHRLAALHPKARNLEIVITLNRFRILAMWIISTSPKTIIRIPIHSFSVILLITMSQNHKIPTYNTTFRRGIILSFYPIITSREI